MGYTTDFEGDIYVEPALNPEKVAWLEKFFGERHEGPEFPSIWCDLEVVLDDSDADDQDKTGIALTWNGSEKTYELEQWFAYLIKNYLKPDGHVLNGTMSAQGEEPDDMWLLHVKDNVVSVEELVATASGKVTVIGDDTPALEAK